MFMGFFNFLSIRLPLAAIGGILYGLLTYYIVILLGLPSQLALFTALAVFLFYLASRLLILFSGIDTPYYSRVERTASEFLYENSSFYHTAQWVGKFYHYHDIVLFIFLALLSITFLISLVMDLAGSKLIGSTIQNLWNFLIPIP
jgi:hypothetical protein